MKYALNIGLYDKRGRFQSFEQFSILEIFRSSIDYFIVYCAQSVNVVFEGLEDSIDITPLDELGETCGYKAYKIIPTNESFWSEFRNVSFNPDSGLSHCYGYNTSGRCVLSIETDDETNFLVIDNIDISKLDGVEVDTSEISSKFRDAIDELVEGEKWKLLIINSK